MAYGTDPIGAGPIGGSAPSGPIPGSTADLTATGLGFSAELDGVPLTGDLAATGLSFSAELDGAPPTADLTATGLGFSAVMDAISDSAGQGTLTGTGLAFGSSMSGDVGATADMTGAGLSFAASLDATVGIRYISGQSLIVNFDVTSGFSQVIGPMELVILDDTLDRAPTSVQVTVSNCASLDGLTFSIDGTIVYLEVSDVDGQLDMTSIPVSEAAGAVGVHTLTVSSTIRGTSTATFTFARGVAASPAVQVVDAGPIFIPASVVGDHFHWVLQDLAPGGLGSWVMPNSPISMSSPHRRRNVSVVHTTAVGGANHAHEGHMPPVDWQFAGYSPDQAFYNQLRAYMNLNHRFYAIDHRGRAWIVAGIGIELRPRKRQNVNGVVSDWHHDYTANCALLDQTWKVPA